MFDWQARSFLISLLFGLLIGTLELPIFKDRPEQADLLLILRGLIFLRLVRGVAFTCCSNGLISMVFRKMLLLVILKNRHICVPHNCNRIIVFSHYQGHLAIVFCMLGPVHGNHCPSLTQDITSGRYSCTILVVGHIDGQIFYRLYFIHNFHPLQ